MRSRFEGVKVASIVPYQREESGDPNSRLGLCNDNSGDKSNVTMPVKGASYAAVTEPLCSSTQAHWTLQ